MTHDGDEEAILLSSSNVAGCFQILLVNNQNINLVIFSMEVFQQYTINSFT